MKARKQTLTASLFTALFLKRVTDIPQPCLAAAYNIIWAEQNKADAGKPNQLLALTEYLCVVCQGQELVAAKHLLANCHRREFRFNQSWDIILTLDDEAISTEFFRHRKHIPGLAIPLNKISRYLPEFSRHWTDQELLELREVFERILEKHQTTLGTNLHNYYADMQDEIFTGIESRMGVILFKPLPKIRPERNPTLERDQRAFTLRCKEALQHEIEQHEKILKPDFRSESDWDMAVRHTLRHGGQGWEFSRSWRGETIPSRIYLIRSALEQRLMNLHREAEDTFRNKSGILPVGEGWISEAKMVSRLRSAFPKLRIETQASPTWLGRYRLDAYFPDHNIAVEYQGEQHNRSVPMFGGLIGLVTTQARDQRKRTLCEANGCQLIEVFPDYDPRDLINRIGSLTQVAACRDTGDSAPTANQSRINRKKINVAKKRLTTVHIGKRNRTGSIGSSDVYSCIRHGNRAMLLSLVDAGCKLQQIDKRCQDSLLFIAASAGNLETLKTLIELGFDVNAKTCHMKATALSQLCHGWAAPNLEGVRALLEAGAEVTLCGRGYGIAGANGSAQPMLAAAITHNLALAKLLREFGADVNILHEKSGHTPFLGACMRKRAINEDARIEMVDWLVKEGANFEQENGLGQNAFDIVLNYQVHERVDSRLIDLLMHLRIPLRRRALDNVLREAQVSSSSRLLELIKYAETVNKK